MRIRAVVFDWAGTTVDYGCRAPVVVLEKIFASRGVSLLPAESRHAMGLLKNDQIREILRLPRVRQAWRSETGSDPDERDVQDLFAAFVPLQLDCIEEYSGVIPGVPELVGKLRGAGIRIGSTTGYTREMINRLLPKAAREGYSPDCVVTPDEVVQGRPYPWMIFENMQRLSVYPPGLCVKIGDTASDVHEGLNAGLITIGVSDSSSDAVLGGSGYARRIQVAAGAHRVLPGAPDLWDILEDL
jgi:phosphonoacetaldehyde hydrolase